MSLIIKLTNFKWRNKTRKDPKIVRQRNPPGDKTTVSNVLKENTFQL